MQICSGDVLMTRVGDLVSEWTDECLHGRLWQDRAGVCSRASGPVDYRVQAEIGAETFVGVMLDEPRT